MIFTISQWWIERIGHDYNMARHARTNDGHERTNTLYKHGPEFYGLGSLAVDRAGLEGVRIVV